MKIIALVFASVSNAESQPPHLVFEKRIIVGRRPRGQREAPGGFRRKCRGSNTSVRSRNGLLLTGIDTRLHILRGNDGYQPASPAMQPRSVRLKRSRRTPIVARTGVTITNPKATAFNVGVDRLYTKSVRGSSNEGISVDRIQR